MATKKSKSFWLIVIMANIAVISASGYVIYTRLDTHFTTSVKEIHPVPVPVPVEKEEEPAPLSAAARQFLAENTPAQAIAKEEKEKPLKPSVIETTQKDSKKSPKKIKAIKTVFKYKNLEAKTVSIAGSFTKWKNIKMEKKKGIWQANVWILPGTYLFHYVVDGQKVLDSSKPTASMGESIIEVGN